ncbi:hypothetical protein MKX01_009766 [Papaver californicum]|nr:hypothetical protein MKX01_009766 [Papaver californicum]
MQNTCVCSIQRALCCCQLLELCLKFVGVSNSVILHNQLPCEYCASFHSSMYLLYCLYFAFISKKSMVSDEEPVDPKKLLEDGCRAKCVRPLFAYRECVTRIKDDDSGQKHCTGQYFDYWFCVDKCVAPLLFKYLK